MFGCILTQWSQSLQLFTGKIQTQDTNVSSHSMPLVEDEICDGRTVRWYALIVHQEELWILTAYTAYSKQLIATEGYMTTWLESDDDLIKRTENSETHISLLHVSDPSTTSNAYRWVLSMDMARDCSDVCFAVENVVETNTRMRLSSIFFYPSCDPIKYIVAMVGWFLWSFEVCEHSSRVCFARFASSNDDLDYGSGTHSTQSGDAHANRISPKTEMKKIYKNRNYCLCWGGDPDIRILINHSVLLIFYGHYSVLPLTNGSNTRL